MSDLLGQVKGEFVRLDDDVYYKISNYDSIPPFFMTLVSSSDHWLFISSSGGMTAGRKNPEHALFPYYTDDKITDSAETTGSRTIIRVRSDQGWNLWEPFSKTYDGIYKLDRNLYKNRIGNKLIFEEVNHDLGIMFSYRWTFSDKFGFVKRCEIENIGKESKEVEVVDGVQNILPAGVSPELQNVRSTLVDAYKKNELHKATGLGVFSLSSMIVDRAEPSESLKATTVWSRGLQNCRYLLSSEQLNAFRHGAEMEEEDILKAKRACFFVNSSFSLNPTGREEWVVVSEVEQSSAKVQNLINLLDGEENVREGVFQDISKTTVELKRMVGLADGLQKGSDLLSTGRHFSNVLFNIMRGGIFEDQYKIDHADLSEYVQIINRKVFKQNDSFFNRIKQSGINRMQLMDGIAANLKPDLHRICSEYLPLSFSRRHGDPSRPWNNFNIELSLDESGKHFNYEGNWRDIFQNWEALAYSYPHFIEAMISKFVNASTIDGYNPYRVTRDGIDWEVIEEDDPWSYIGYWGDHQVIYLLKMLEHSEKHFPGKFARLLGQDNFVYANVPYRIRSYTTIRTNPNDTIEFQHDKAEIIDARVKKIGGDGKLVFGPGGQIIHVNLCEKLLVMLLAKMYNFVPHGGIWMNTQRPEWNDANNALVGNGLSMVTLNYLHRCIGFFKDVFEQVPDTKFEIRKSVHQLMQMVNHTVSRFNKGGLSTEPALLREFIDELGFAGEAYRVQSYKNPEEGKIKVGAQEILEFLDECLISLVDTIDHGKREDGLFHAYNVLVFGEHEAYVKPLYEMLEGQVAAISSGHLSSAEVLNILDRLKTSALFREDQYSYLLYPDRQLTPFTDKNIIPQEELMNSQLIQSLLSGGGYGILEQDKHGGVHFAGDIHNALVLKSKMDQLNSVELSGMVEIEGQRLIDIYESLFDHLSFTGRSGTFYGYEGLGCIYWHMVSKLLVSVQESIIRSVVHGEDREIINRLKDHYYEIRAGIGVNKSPDLYGAFPTDAYSHTPGDAGVQQPGMTGQVKEDILNRWAELGVIVKNAELHFLPEIFARHELLSKELKFQYFDFEGQEQYIELHVGEFAFTYCGLMIVYKYSEVPSLSYKRKDGSIKYLEGMRLSSDEASEVFSRSGQIVEIRLDFPFHE